MGFWINHRYPDSNLHELDLSWVINVVKEMIKEWNEFVPGHTIKISDPIEWDIKYHYDSYTLVLAPNGDSYLSIREVPAGIRLTNHRYWFKVASYDAQFENLKQGLRNYMQRGSYYRIYLSATEGSDDNDGLSSDQPVQTFERALKIGYEMCNEFRIYMLDDSVYDFPWLTLSSSTLHIISETGATIRINSGVAFYNCHLNFQGLHVTGNGNWYCDNSFILLRDCVFDVGYTHNGGSFQSNNCQFSNVTLNFTMGWFTDTIFNDLTNTNKATSLELKSSYIRVSGVFKTNYTQPVTTAFSLLSSTFLVSSTLVNDGITPTHGIHNNASIVIATRNRYEALPDTLIDNGGICMTDYYNIQATSMTRTINEIVAGAYFTSPDTIRFSVTSPMYYPYSNVSASINLLSVYMSDGAHTPTIESVTATSHASNIVIDVKLSDLTGTSGTPCTVRVSPVLNLSL